MYMMELGTVMVGIALAQISPGPNMMAVSSAALSGGRQLGLLSAVGVATGVFIDAFPQSLTAMKLVGGGYFLYLALKSLWSCLKGSGSVGSARDNLYSPASKIGFTAYRTGLLVVLTNPKAALMWVAVSMFLASAQGTHPALIVIGVLASCSAMVIYGIYALLFSTGVAVRAYQGFFRVVDGIFGAVFGVIGSKILIDGMSDLRS
ncbi:LysE family translocator [Thalassospira sp. MCCC 1A03138]|uniref:LysE family translocator n=1 Tax=Thalassospira sp. MCCC 1A03138 TaxID=1470576 RepID=UPI000A1E8570|nr:LysE family translocator [Thalassospira sp. MCCC 1A03138]OSQ31705.1 hypothetical protein TH468_06590 [Thalassospira sp. MCCC 1A03138]